MAENLGSIRYDVEVNTADTLKADAVVSKTTNNMVNDFNKVDAASKKLSTQMTKSAEGVKKGVHRNFGQAGIQVQQFVGQLQGGQSAMLALSQQSADLGIVLGAPMIGVLLSLSAVLAGVLLPAIMDTKTSVEKLDTAIGHAKAVMSVGAGGIVEYTEKMQELGRVSQMVAEFQIATAMKKAKEGVKSAVKSMADELSKVDDTIFGTQFGFAVENSAILATNSMRNYTVTVGNLLGEVGSASDRSGDKAQKMGAKFIKLFAELSKAETPKAVTGIQEEIIKMATATGKADKKFLEMIESLMAAGEGTEDYFAKLRTLTALLEEGSKGQTDFTNKTNKLTSAFADNIKQLSLQNILLKEGERAAYSASLVAEGFTQSQVKAQLAIYDANKALESDIETKKEATKENDDYKKSIDGVNDSLDVFFDKESSDSTKKDDQRKATLTTQVQSVGLTDEEEIRARYKRELELLKEAEEEGIEIRGTYKERREQLAFEEAEALKNIHTENNMFLEEAFGNLDTQIAGTMAQVITGAKDGKEAIASLADTMLTQLIGAAVQYGVEMVKNQMLGNVLAASEQANIVATTATGVAAQSAATTSTVAAAATTATAAAPAAALTSTFSFGSAALIGGAALLGTLAISKMMASSGGREFGGPVSAGSMYRVGEKGKPEFYKDNLGNLSMIPGENGEVIPANKMGGSGGGMTVQVNNYTPYQVYVTQDQATSIAKVEIGNEAGKLQKGRGSMYNAMKSGGNYSNNAKR